MSKITPGRWHLDRVAQHPWKVVTPYRDGLPGMATLAEVGYRPNAVAIAAVPQMIEALEAAKEALANTMPVFPDTERKVNEALRAAGVE